MNHQRGFLQERNMLLSVCNNNCYCISGLPDDIDKYRLNIIDALDVNDLNVYYLRAGIAGVSLIGAIQKLKRWHVVCIRHRLDQSVKKTGVFF